MGEEKEDENSIEKGDGQSTGDQSENADVESSENIV